MDPARLVARLDHILAAIDAIESYRSGRDFEALAREPMFRDAVERNIERLSEASRWIPEALRERRPDIPWRAIADIGNVLRHAYDGISDERIWKTVVDDLPILREAILELRASIEI